MTNDFLKPPPRRDARQDGSARDQRGGAFEVMFRQRAQRAARTRLTSEERAGASAAQLAVLEAAVKAIDNWSPEMIAGMVSTFAWRAVQLDAQRRVHRRPSKPPTKELTDTAVSA
jgi:hypothetical protein